MICHTIEPTFCRIKEAEKKVKEIQEGKKSTSTTPVRSKGLVSVSCSLFTRLETVFRHKLEKLVEFQE